MKKYAKYIHTYIYHKLAANFRAHKFAKTKMRK